MTQTQRKPHSMAQNCDPGCGAKFRFEGDTLGEVLAAFRQWWEQHRSCNEDAA